MEIKMSGRGGKRRGAGRKRGVPNMLTANIKEAVQNAFLEVGGENYLVKVAKEDPRTFCTLLGKILPTQVEAKAEEPITYQFITGVPRRDDDSA
jgi:hypothetical protein